jgi:hypothetical protein
MHCIEDNFVKVTVVGDCNPYTDHYCVLGVLLCVGSKSNENTSTTFLASCICCNITSGLQVILYFLVIPVDDFLDWED